MTKSEIELFDTGMLGAIALFLNQYFNCVISEYALLWIAMVSYMHTFSLINFKEYTLHPQFPY